MKITIHSTVIFLMLFSSLFSKSFENGQIEVFISKYNDLTVKKYVLEEQIVTFIKEARVSLAVAVQELRVKDSTVANPIKKAILDAANRGVRVRLIVEKSYLKDRSDNLNTFIEFTQHENIQVHADENSKIFHDKFIVRDYDEKTAALLTGSTNFTDTGTRNNYNHIIIIHFNKKAQKKQSYQILTRYKDEFEELWSGVFGNNQPEQEIKHYRIGKTTIKVLFSPDNNPDDILLKTVTDADSSLDLMIFTFGSNSPLMAGVINRFNAVKYVNRKPTEDPKVKIRVGLESQQAQYWSVYPTFRKLGIPVKLETDSTAKLHHKVGIIDGERVILGSYNWTLSANDDNDENTLIVKNRAIAAMFTEAFNELWDKVLK